MSGDIQPILVTGANGFIGSWIIAELTKSGQPVIAADKEFETRRLQQMLPSEKQRLVRFISCDVSDNASVWKVVSETVPSTIIHLAALQIPECRDNPVLCAKVNILGQVNIFDAARKAGVKKVIYTSSAAAKPRGEDNAPANLYGIFKKTDEEIARIFFQEHGISSLGLRPYIVYGFGRDNGETSAITKAMRAAALNEEYTIPFRTYACIEYVGEIADIFCRTTKATWEGAKVSDLTTQIYSVDDILEAIYHCVPNARISSENTIRVSPDIEFDNSVLVELIGEWPNVTLKEGTRRTIEHYRSLLGKA
tara:strand:- start:593 stop:1516 length:924 start_codon:yes stop_codon:yes gene_type:complete